MPGSRGDVRDVSVGLQHPRVWQSCFPVASTVMATTALFHVTLAAPAAALVSWPACWAQALAWPKPDVRELRMQHACGENISCTCKVSFHQSWKCVIVPFPPHRGGFRLPSAPSSTNSPPLHYSLEPRQHMALFFPVFLSLVVLNPSLSCESSRVACFIRPRMQRRQYGAGNIEF